MSSLLAKSTNEQLQQVETILYSQVDSSSFDVPPALYEIIASGGKRLRPRITLLVGSVLGAGNERLVHLAAAVEMLHTASLIHDDLIDNSLLRRGNTTLNAQHSPLITVLAGDFAFARAAKLAADTDSNPVMRLFAETLTIMTSGEIAQARKKNSIASRADYYHWIHAKTASLFELAAGAAALISPVDEQTVASAKRFGYELGMAFQIVDDILDFTGDASSLGKPTGSDLRQGVVTLPALYYLERHPEYPLDLVLQQVKDKEAENSRLEQLIADIRMNGSIHLARQEAEKFVQRSLDALAALPDTAERHSLAEIARSVIRKDA